MMKDAKYSFQFFLLIFTKNNCPPLVADLRTLSKVLSLLFFDLYNYLKKGISLLLTMSNFVNIGIFC